MNQIKAELSLFTGNILPLFSEFSVSSSVPFSLTTHHTQQNQFYFESILNFSYQIENMIFIISLIELQEAFHNSFIY